MNIEIDRNKVRQIERYIDRKINRWRDRQIDKNKDPVKKVYFWLSISFLYVQLSIHERTV